MLISIIILTRNDEQNLAAVLDRLAEQAGGYEIIVVNGNSSDEPPALVEGRAKLVFAPYAAQGEQLNAGAAVARGDILLFLDLHSWLPANALRAIERNFKLLPQTIGGNFHLRFEKDSLFTKLLVCFLQWWRYRGSYCGNSGIFIRKNVYQAIGGFQPDVTLTDYGFAYRMENYGPTVYLPDPIVAPVPGYWEALNWLIAPIFMQHKS